MKIPFLTRNPLGRFGELLDAEDRTFGRYTDLQKAIDFYRNGKTDKPEYVGKNPEDVLQAALKGYLSSKERLLSFVGTVGIHEQSLAEQVTLLEKGETVYRQDLPEPYRRLLADLGPEVVAERNRRTEWIMDKWRKAQNPGLYAPDTIDMRCANLPVARMAYNGGSHSTIDALALPESPEQDKVVLEALLTRAKEHRPNTDFPRGSANLN